VQTLVVIDAQNEFSAEGRRPVPNHTAALAAIRRRVADARREGRPIAWVRHHNRPGEDPSGVPAFVSDSWGAAFSPGLGPVPEHAEEVELVKDVFGAFTGTALGAWLEDVGSDDVLLVGFFAHMCVSTTAREALMRGLTVAVDPDATGGSPLRHPRLGELSADEVRRTALLHLSHLGAEITPRPPAVRPMPAGAEIVGTATALAEG
jgi:nicotinamidase-related amidase